MPALRESPARRLEQAGEAPASPADARLDGLASRSLADAGQPVRQSAGLDFGLVLACLGLVAAAALLGLSEDGRAATRRSGRRIAGLLRPLLGRR